MAPTCVPSRAAVLAFVFLATACGNGSTTEPPPGPVAVASVEVTPAADTLTALGQTQQLSATALDGQGNPVSGVTFTWSSSDESLATVSETGLVTALGTGQVQITATVQNVGGTAALLIAQEVTSVTVTPETATLTTAGATQEFEAQAFDANDNPVTDVRFVWQSSNQNVAVVDTAGVASAVGNGTATITASAVGVPGNAVLSVNQEIATLAFLTGPTDVMAGEAMDPAIRVEVRDVGGSRVPDAELPVTLSLAADPGGAALAGTKTVNAVSGVATFSGLWLDRAAEDYTLQAAAADLDPVESAAFTVSPAPAARLALLTQLETTTAGEPLAPTVEAEVQDRFGNRIPDATDPVTVAFAVNPAGGTLLGTVTVDAVEGVAVFPDLSIERAGEGYRIEVSSGSLEGALGVAFEITPAAPAELALLTQPGTVEGQVPFDPVEVAVRDAFGNRVTDTAPDVTVTLSQSPSGEGLGGSTTTSPVDGVATFTDLTLALPGDGFVLEATSGGLTPAQSGAFDVRLTFAQESAGAGHTCALTAAGFAYCWGGNGNGRLGDGTTEQRETPAPVAGGLRFVQVSASSSHTCGVTTDAAAYCWGWNGSGRLGDGTTEQRESPTPVAGGLSFAQVSAGGAYTCGVTTGSAAYCWGWNENGQLGDGTTAQRETPTLVTGSLSFARVRAGLSHTCGVTTDSVAYCWGLNSVGQLGDGTTEQREVPTPVAGELSFAEVSPGSFHTCGVTAANSAYCWGANFSGRLGDGTTVQRETPTPVVGGLSFAEVSAGGTHTCGVTTGNAAYCWGSNGDGRLGDGTTEQRETPTLVAGVLGFTGVTTGQHTCGLAAGNIAYCWGPNSNGQLGNGTTDGSFTPTRVLH